MKPVIVVFGKYFGYAVGGAERSMLEILRQKEQQGHRICAVVCEGVQTLGAKAARMTLPDSWEILRFRFRVDLARFRHLAYCLNRKALGDFFAALPKDWHLYAYGIYAPAAVVRFRGHASYFVRDEYALGWDVNYERGLKRFLRVGYQMVEAPARTIWLRDLRRCMRRADLVANSSFIARELEKCVPGKSVQLLLPQVDCAALRAEYACSVEARAVETGIVMMGNDRLKGADIVIRIARAMPDRLFYVFSRQTSEPTQAGNIRYMPWQSSPGMLYAHARLVLVPSRSAEAFPRAVLEAQCLGIPVVASARGGIPDAMTDKDALVHDLEDIDAWAAKIRQYSST